MKVTVLGTSCTWFKRNNTSYIIDNDILFDAPQGSYKSIIKEIDIFKLKAIVISHMHTDHVLDLHIITTRVMRENRGRTEPLRIYAPKGLFDKILKLHELFFAADDECDRNSYAGKVEFIDLEDGMTFSESEYNITAYKVEHGKPESYGFTFEDKKGMVVGFSGDTILCDNLYKIIEKSKYAFVEAAAAKVSKTHITLAEYLELREKYPNTEFYPVHTCDECQQYLEDNNLNAVHDGDVFKFEE